MLMMSHYPKDYVDTCRNNMKGQVAAYRKLLATKPSGAGTQFFNHLLLALDRYFVHRGRGIEGKDGNPLNEVRMLSESIMENGGHLIDINTIRYKPEESVLKIAIGDEIRLNADDFTRLSEAFFVELEKKFSGA